MVEVRNVTYSYGRGLHNVLDHIGFEIENGQCVGIMGNNGAGKSTLLKCINSILPAKGVSVMIDGKDIFKMTAKKRAQVLAYVQQSTVPLNMTVYDTVLMGRKPYITWDAAKKDHEIVKEALYEMGLESYALRNLSMLSGGEIQKVMLARAIAQEPEFLLLDEPTSSLDPYNQHEVLQNIKKITKEKKICTAIVIHDLNLAIRYCDRFLFLKGSNIYSLGGMEVVTPKTIKDVYGLPVEVVDYANRKVVVAI